MTCRRCHQRLHTPLSLSRGYGPVCWLAVGKQLTLFDDSEPSAHSQKTRAEKPLQPREAQVPGFDLIASGHGYRRADHLGGDANAVPSEEIRPSDRRTAKHASMAENDVPAVHAHGHRMRDVERVLGRGDPSLPGVDAETALLGGEGGEAAVDQLAFGGAHRGIIPRARGS